MKLMKPDTVVTRGVKNFKTKDVQKTEIDPIAPSSGLEWKQASPYNTTN
jgi:hypothetical protein